MTNGYVLCVHVKNEARYISPLLESIAVQTLLPNLVVVVDDYSTDETYSRVEEFTQSHSWVKLFRYQSQGESETDFALHFSQVRSYSVNLLIEHCEANAISYDYVGILDADMKIDSTFYRRMVDRLSQEKTLGIVSAMIYEPSHSGQYYLKASRPDLPGGATLMLAKECLKDIGGVPADMYPEDAIMVARAKLRNWKTRRLQDITAIQMRKTSSARGQRNGFRYEGEKVYFLRHGPLYVLLRTIYISIFQRVDYGWAFLGGYLKKLLRKEKRLNDEELIGYFRKRRFREIVQHRLGRIMESSDAKKQ